MYSKHMQQMHHWLSVWHVGIKNCSFRLATVGLWTYLHHPSNVPPPLRGGLNFQGDFGILGHCLGSRRHGKTSLLLLRGCGVEASGAESYEMGQNIGFTNNWWYLCCRKFATKNDDIQKLCLHHSNIHYGQLMRAGTSQNSLAPRANPLHEHKLWMLKLLDWNWLGFSIPFKH